MDFPLELSGLARFMNLSSKPEFKQLLQVVNIKFAKDVEHSDVVLAKSGFLREAVAAKKVILQFENLKDCMISDPQLVKFVKWLNDQEEDDPKEDKAKFVRAYHQWYAEHEEEDETSWKCQYVFDRLGIPNAIFLSISGIGNYSLVAIIKRDNKRQAMRITKQAPSEEEMQIQELLAANGLAPEIVGREIVNNLNVEIMQAVVMTLQKFIETTELTDGIIYELTDNFQATLNQLDELGVMHGDAHFKNWGLTAEGKLLIFDFDNSSRRFRIPTFDLATVYNALDDDFFVPKTHRWVEKMRARLLPHLDTMWRNEDKTFNAVKFSSVRFKWVRFMKFQSDDSFQALQEEVPELEDRQTKQ